MSETFANRVAVITGASSGIGWALTKALAAEGCKLGLLARRKEKLQALAGEIRQSGGTAAFAPADVANRGETVAAIAELRAQLGPVDLVIANAGIGMPTLLDPPNTEDIEKMMQVNFFGTVYTFEAILPEMLRRRQGHLAAVSSLAAYKGMPGEGGYCASKAALNIYLESLRIHVRDRRIAVTTICPGFVQTPMTAVNKFHMPFLLSADQAAARIVRALKRRRKIYDFPWQTSLLMKLARCLPDWVLARSMRTYNEDPPFPETSG